ncbi:hypothetical protein Zm00014a_040548 [Zea mays]
MFLRR